MEADRPAGGRDPIKVATDLGQIWFWGRDRGKPLVLMITGAMAPADVWAGEFDELDYLRVHLPGNHCPPLAETSIAAFARSIDQALAMNFSGRPVFVAGISMGALVGLAMRSPELRGALLIEPPLRTRHLWSVQRMPMEAGLTEQDLLLLKNVLGVSKAGSEPRDYTHLLAGLRVRTTVVVGSEPLLPKRKVARVPSVVDDDDRALLAAHPLVRIVLVEGAGHAVHAEGFVPVTRLMFAEATAALLG
ncbi:MAG: alpha/beta hydrolase [Phenylobacterium sp.]|nr:MAG: alpha/beta hydrolase [Phenylobacterium sp.]